MYSNLGGFEWLFLLGMLALYAWLVIWIGKKAEQKGYSRAGFTVLAIFFTLIALIIVLVLKPRQTMFLE